MLTILKHSYLISADIKFQLQNIEIICNKQNI